MGPVILFRRICAALTRIGHGQGTVEFALVLPIFLLLVLGIVDLGRGIASYNVISNASHEGARAGIFQSVTDPEIRVAVNSQAKLLGTIPNGDITIARTSTTITVGVTYTYAPLTPMLSRIIGSNITLTASSTMPME